MSIPFASVSMLQVDGGSSKTAEDSIAIEEPLEIRLGYGPGVNRQRVTVAVTMRTPGHDIELAVGYLLGEQLLSDPTDLLSTTIQSPNIVRVDLKPQCTVDLQRLERRGVVNSSCGLCGRTTLETMEAEGLSVLEPGPVFASSQIPQLAKQLRSSQPGFDQTGGLHAMGLFDFEGRQVMVREDVGRHNALDKLLGAEFLAGRMRLSDRIVMASSRASFELVQKAIQAGVPILAAVGAPTSLAVMMAERFGLTLIGFVREDRLNIYTGRERIAL